MNVIVYVYIISNCKVKTGKLLYKCKFFVSWLVCIACSSRNAQNLRITDNTALKNFMLTIGFRIILIFCSLPSSIID